MYTTENKNSFSFKNVILQFLFVALFIFIMIWLFPLKSDLKRIESKIESTQTDFSVLYDRIFNENVIAMKDGAKSYFTTSRLPKNVGDKTKMTLKEMLNAKIVLPFTDKNGDVCDEEASYVEITKYEDEYVMKVNLKCGDQENYLLVYMGCYDYCSTTLCEKNKADITTPIIYPSNPQPQPVQPTPQPEKPIQNITINNITNNTTINNNITVNITVPEPVVPKPIVYYCAVVEGKYYDKLGNVVSKEAYEESCFPKPIEKHFCEIVDGKYYDKAGNVVSKEVYEAACITIPEVHYCEVVNGKYYDKAGNVVSKEAYEESCYNKLIQYEYSKTIWSNWSNWSTTKVEATATKNVQSRDVYTTYLVGYEKVEVDDTTKPIFETVQTVTKTSSITYCDKYDYVATGEVKYTQWQEQGEFRFTVAPGENSSDTPKNTDTARYERVGSYNWYCDKECTSGTTLVYKVYTRTPVNVVQSKCVSNKTVDVVKVSYNSVRTGFEKKYVKGDPIYVKKLTGKEYRYRTSSTDTKWSYSKTDSTLLNNGYSLTGKTKTSIVKK